MTAKKQLPALPDINIPENIGEYLTQYENNLPNDEQALWDGVNHSMKVELFSYIDSGIKLKKLKAISEHGTFIQRLQEFNIHPRNVQRRIAVATRFCELEKIKYDTVSHLEIGKVLELIKWDDQEIIDFIEGVEVKGLKIEEALTMSKREFIATIKDNKDEDTKNLIDENKRLSTELEFAQEDINDLENRLEQQNVLGDWDELTNIVRSETAALSDKVIFSLDDINRVSQKLINEGSELNESNTNASVGILLHNLKTIYAKSHAIITELSNHYDSIDDFLSLENMAPLSGDEVKHLVTNRQVFMREREVERLQRAQEREAKKPKSKGRPRVKFEEI
jgi:hypothetical protein